MRKGCPGVRQVKFHCVDCGKSLRTAGKHRDWRERKEKRCKSCAIKKRCTKTLTQTKPEKNELTKVIHKSRLVVLHVNDGKGLQNQINALDSRVECLEHRDPRKIIQQQEIDVPYHLYRSYHALKALGGKASAQEVSNRTGRCRAVESSDLNVLVTLGILNKYRSGRVAVFQLINNQFPDSLREVASS